MTPDPFIDGVQRPNSPAPPTFFENALQFRSWLHKNHGAQDELIVGFRKVGSSMPGMTWSQSADEALCYGWIDGVRKRIDEKSYQIRFTPRRFNSIWSLVNVAKVHALIAQLRMQPAGMAAYKARDHKKTGIYAFKQEQPAEFAMEDAVSFRQSAAAWKYFESSAPGYRRVMTHWVVSAKQAGIRARRLAQLMQACTEQRRILK